MFCSQCACSLTVKEDAGPSDVAGSFHPGVLCSWSGNGAANWIVKPFKALFSRPERCHCCWCHTASGVPVLCRNSLLCSGVQSRAYENGCL